MLEKLMDEAWGRIMGGDQCPSCKNQLEILRAGGCGGIGAEYGCETCNAVFIQANGGVVSPSEGIRYKKLEGCTLAEYREKSQGPSE